MQFGSVPRPQSESYPVTYLLRFRGPRRPPRFVSRSLRSRKVEGCFAGRGHCSTGDPNCRFTLTWIGISQVSRRSILCLCPALRPRLNRRSLASLTVSSMLPPHFPRQGLQRLMNFGALSRGFGTCCLRFKNRVATIPARLASGWLSRLYRQGVEPSGSLQKVSDHISRPPFLDLSWRKGSFMMMPPKCGVSLPLS